MTTTFSKMLCGDFFYAFVGQQRWTAGTYGHKSALLHCAPLWQLDFLILIPRRGKLQGGTERQESETQTLFLLRQNHCPICWSPLRLCRHWRKVQIKSSAWWRLLLSLTLNEAGRDDGGRWSWSTIGWINYKALRNDISTGRSEEGEGQGWEESIHPDLTS